MSTEITRRRALLGLGASVLPTSLWATPGSYLEAIQAYARDHPDDLATLEAYLDPEAAADILQLPTGRVAQTSPQDYEAIADGRLVLYNRPRRADQDVDRLEIGLPTQGVFSPSQMEAVNYVFRDMRNDQEWSVDPQLVSMLGEVVKILGVPVYGTSLYRSPSTQAALIAASKQRNGGVSQVATNSFHSNRNGTVKAADLQCELGVPVLWRAVVSVCSTRAQGGHGRYSSFVHLDSAHFRTW